MNIVQIEENIQKLMKSFLRKTFIYDFLRAYGLPKSSITRLQKGNLNLSKKEGEISWKKKLFFKEEYEEDLHLLITNLKKELKHNQRFVVVTDYKTLLAIDTKTEDKLDIPFDDLPKHYDFFLPWAGMEKAQHANENPADVKAAERMAKLFDEIKRDNPDNSPVSIHALNIFLSRLLFCFFAEDTHIFKDSQFTNSVDSHTQADGSDLNNYLDTLFDVLNTPEDKRGDLPEYLKAFPYVNGGLFKDKLSAPVFTRSSRNALLNSGDQDWSAINPDIFGSMFQAVIATDQRGSLGQHYTSVPNIMKVIEPLFLNGLYEEFEAASGSKKKLHALLNRIYNLKIFDPACGSGNFLIIAYKELCILEMKIFKELENVGKGQKLLPYSGITLSQFYGIEVDDFAHEIAKLALWLAEHQMNVVFLKEFGRTNPTLPLKDAGHITHGNACRIDWNQVCPKENDKRVYILGNPPYLGAKRQNKAQKNELSNIFNGIKGYKNLDYISNWFYIGSKYLKNTKNKLAFVTTNSITQGDQVGLLWPNIFSLDVEIILAHSTFKWGNNAKGEAGVSCVIVGLGSKSDCKKRIYSEKHVIDCKEISPYLTPDSKTIVRKRTTSLSNLPLMSYGNMPLEGGFLKLNIADRQKLLSKHPNAKKLIRPIIGGDEFLNGYERYALWIDDNQLEDANKIPEIRERIEKVYDFRVNGGEVARSLLERSHQFRYRKEAKENFILIPCTSSEKREYLQCGFFDKIYVSLNSAQIIYDTDPYIFGLLSSKLHMLWSKATAGTLESRLRYSTQLCYNTFPFPSISSQRKDEMTQAVFRILEEREKNSDKTLAQLYDPDKMPDGLRETHRQNDEIIEKCYRSKPFNSDDERLEHLFKLYEKMIADEKEQGSLFEDKKTKRKRKKK